MSARHAGGIDVERVLLFSPAGVPLAVGVARSQRSLLGRVISAGWQNM